MRAVARIRPGYELEAGITRRADFKPGVFGVRTTMAYVLDAIGVEKNPVVQPAQPWAAVVEPRHEKPSVLPVEPVRILCCFLLLESGRARLSLCR